MQIQKAVNLQSDFGTIIVNYGVVNHGQWGHLMETVRQGILNKTANKIASLSSLFINFNFSICYPEIIPSSASYVFSTSCL